MHREYNTITIDGKDQEIKFTVKFNKEQCNWATSQRKEIGYQVTATPVTRTKREGGFIIEEFGAFTGFNDCLLAVERQSKKRLEASLKILAERKEMYLNYFKEKLKNA